MLIFTLLQGCANASICARYDMALSITPKYTLIYPRILRKRGYECLGCFAYFTAVRVVNGKYSTSEY